MKASKPLVNRSLFLVIAVTFAVLMTGCSDFGQPMGIPAGPDANEKKAAEEKAKAEAESSYTSDSQAVTETTASQKDSSQKKTAEQSTEKRETPWVELTAINQGLALSADGEIDDKQLTAGCSSLASYEADISKRIKYIAGYNLPADSSVSSDLKLINTAGKFPNTVIFLPYAAKRTETAVNEAIGSGCGLDQNTTVIGEVKIKKALDPAPLRDIVLIEVTKSKKSEEQSPWKEKRVELRRTFETSDAKRVENISIGIYRTNFSNVVHADEFGAKVKLLNRNIENDIVLSLYEVTLNNFELKEYFAQSPIETITVQSKQNRVMLVEARSSKDGQKSAIRYQRSLEPLPAPWDSREEQVLRSIVNVLGYFDGFSI
jgi:hypothetical protein